MSRCGASSRAFARPASSQPRARPRWVGSLAKPTVRAGDAERDARIDALDRVLDRRQHAVGELDVAGEKLLGIGAGNLAIVLVHEVSERDLAAIDRSLESGRDLPGGLDGGLDQRRVG